MASPIELAVVPFDASRSGEEAGRLLPRALRSMARPDERRPGRFAARYLAFLAGRAGVATLFERRGIQGMVCAHSPLGYLEVFSRPGAQPLPYFVNISHTAGIAVAALGPSPVGIDIEGKGRDATRALKRVASEAELRAAKHFEMSGAGLPGGISLWSAKEAAGKAVGLGLKFGLRDFAIGLDEKAPCSIRISRKGPLTLSQPAVQMLSYRGFVIAVVSERKDLTPLPAIISEL